MSDTEYHTPTEDTNDNLDGSVTVEECISKANTYKASGNELYKQAKFKDSSECYENGISWIKKIQKLEPSHKQLLSILYSNLCAACIENCDYTKAIVNADNAIINNEDNVKAYYRRAQALFNTGSFEEALKDCDHLLKLDKNDANVNNLARKINQKMKAAEKEQKKTFGGLFSKVGGLYDDRQIEMQNKKQKKYEDYLKEQREKGEEEMDFESWEKFEQDEEAKKEVERTNKVKEEDASKSKNQEDETPEFDEEDQKIINETKKMGYCYFGKKKDDTTEEATPTNRTNNTVLPVRQKVSPESNVQEASKRAISSWNAQGTTYEEKDMTQWCKRKLEEVLMKASYANEPNTNDSNKNILEMFNDINLDNLDNGGLSKLQKLAGMVHKSSIEPISVEALEGDGQIAFIRGTRRYLFDFSCNINLEIKIDTSIGSTKTEEKAEEEQLSTYKGELELKEISSEMESGKSWKDYMKVNYKSKMKSEHEELVKDMMEIFKQSVSEKIEEFISEYKNQ
ncbi:HSP70/90 co-chaperone [Theileria orientalis]|uniref:HSP70/90 co-chaperone n=1 Tax=Theileria orientalis TaxID=68886 RepID=A0A976QX90_THEOR|nr:HSP70/90 co-chaperone [Theileria orientalis]